MSRALALTLVLAMTAPACVQAGELYDFTVEKPKISGKVPAAAGDAFLAGVNYPWFNYGTDFGSTAWGYRGVASLGVRSAVNADFELLAGKGVKTVRWFVFCDGRAGLDYDQSGLVTGVSGSCYGDMDAALAIAQSHGIRLILVLFDFHVFDKAQMVRAGSRPADTAASSRTPKPRTASLPRRWAPSLSCRYGLPEDWGWTCIQVQIGPKALTK